MSFNIRPPATFLDSLTNAAVDYLVYVSKPNTDPTDATQRVILRDQNTGEQVDNPFVIGSSGYAKNANGNIIIPYCDELKVAIRFESADGGIQWEARNVESDAFGISGGSAEDMMVDQTLDNFQEALATDLTEFDLVFIQSETPDWRDTAEGPQNPYYAYKTGSISDPSTGTAADFYDANGNQWKLVLQPYVYADLDIDQDITGVKTFTDDVILSNNKYEYILGVNGEIDSPGTMRMKIDSINRYSLTQRSEDGNNWISLETILSNGSKFISGRVIFSNKVSISNNIPITFRNSDDQEDELGSYRLFNGTSNILIIQKYIDGAWVNKYAIREATQTFYDNEGIAVARIREGGTDLADAQTIVTREKGDARYLESDKLVDFFLSGNSNAGVPSSWVVTYELVSGNSDRYTITHNLNKQLRPMITYNTLGDATEETIRPPYVLSTSANSFVLIGKGDLSGGGRASLNVLVKT